MRYITACMLLLLCGSCGKEDINCNYSIVTSQVTSYTDSTTYYTTTDTIFLSSAIGYGFYCDTADYAPASFEAATNGILTQKVNNSQLYSELSSTYNTQTGELSIDGVTRDWVTLLVCDLQNEIYAYRRFNVGDGLKQIVTTLNFYPQKFEDNPDTTFTTNGWQFKK